MWSIPSSLSVDNEVYDAIRDECIRQQEHIELIASENFVSPAVMVIQTDGIMADAVLSIVLKRLRSNVQKNCIMPSMQMFSRIAVRRQMRLYILHFSIPGIQFWV